ncbi:non-canonical purine NTP pyrophosphatase [Paenibacillus selenitireducens]|uniref:dITP/XTP pyrophosphatase n=1 Tax=Paenibacillus selenitireducens TaxID=1324314 RepID=A0A1T2XKT8_9BACL|nr:XTP/dITP diphosphatase [Paenibacillus selenitireducens]OPA80293.1 non-canonical purine NTP pyrophosphatase [Paenibacillus selenitireducens]
MVNQIAHDTIIVATKNKGKVKEFAHAFAAIGKNVQSMYDYPDLPDVVEDGETFADNALKKAKTVALALGIPVLADDSGLCVDKLDGAPGVYSARYAGEGATDEANNKKLLDTLGQMEQGEDTEQPLLSPAQFVCTLVVYDPETDRVIQASGDVEGFIIAEPRGFGGFGYDPLFYLPEYDKTMAELTMEEKQAISHRGRALEQLMSQISRNPS